MKQHVCRQYGNVSRHGAHAEEVKQEVSCVLSTDAVVHPHAVVIKTLDTSVADSCEANRVYSAMLLLSLPCGVFVLTAVLGAGRFDELARWTADSRVKQPSVIWVDVNLARDFLLCHCACGEVKVM